MNTLPKYIKDNFNLENYFDNTTQRYNYSKIVKDFWKTGLFTSAKLDLLPAVMIFGKGKLYQTIVLDTIEKELSNWKKED